MIAFAVGAIPEQIDDGKSGYLSEAGNNRKFAEKLKEAKEMSGEGYEKMCRYAYTYGNNKYSALGAADRFARLINLVGEGTRHEVDSCTSFAASWMQEVAA